MAATNRGKYRILESYFRGVSAPSNFYVALVTADNVPDADTNVFSDLTEIAAGNGYASGGYSLTPGVTDFDTLTEDDTEDEGQIQIKDVAWNASGGPIPASGNPARYVVLLDDDATVADREVLDWWDLGGNVSVTDGNPLTLVDLEIFAGAPA